MVKTSTPVIQICCGEDKFNIIQDKDLSCFFNNNSLVTTKVDDRSFGPITGMLVRSSIRKLGTEIIIKNSSTMNDLVKDIIDTVNKSEQEKIKVLESKPDEMTENSPLEAKLQVGALNRYQSNLKIYSETFDDALSLSEVLLKTNLPKTMWGAKELKASLSKMKTASVNLLTHREAFEAAAEQTDLRLGQIIPSLFDRKMSNKHVEVSIDHIITSFRTMKSLMASFMQSFHGLYASDTLFKKHTGYPATWFYDPSVFFNFKERYADISDNLIAASRDESSVIRPLYALQK